MENIRIRKLFLILFFSVFVVFALTAQPGEPPGGSGGGVPVGGEAGVPLDGGLLSMLLAGIAICAYRKLRHK
jgi:hypothetical protein